MEWVCYVFEKDRSIYLIADDTIESAWRSLAKRQSISIENCKKQYKFIESMNGNDNVWKIKKQY